LKNPKIREKSLANYPLLCRGLLQSCLNRTLEKKHVEAGKREKVNRTGNAFSLFLSFPTLSFLSPVLPFSLSLLFTRRSLCGGESANYIQRFKNLELLPKNDVSTQINFF